MQEIELNGESRNITQDNIDKLKQIFPEVFYENKIDFDKLQAVLGENIDTEDEKYRFTWNGKMNALRLSQTPSTGTLRPCKADSVEWDTTQNLYIEGDNLEVLKLLQNSYLNKIKMIYIDPPYNTGNDFVYKDDFKDNIENYKKITGQVDNEGNATSTNKDTDGRYHTNWLNMMYPRLRLARNLLTDDGVIFISIDDYEAINLKKICDEIFGEANFINQVVWVRNSSGKTVSNELAVNIEYLLIYAKSSQYALKPIYKPLSEATIKMYSKDDNDGRGKYRLYPMQKTKDPGPETTYDYIDNNGKVWPCPAKGWRMCYSKMKALEDDGRLCLENSTISEKAYWNERDAEGKLADSFWNDLSVAFDTIDDEYLQKIVNYYTDVCKGVSENSSGSKEVNALFDGRAVFSNPKPTDYIERMLKMQTDNDSIILDFFSGSSSTAHAVMKLNNEDGGNRKFIMSQLPQSLNPLDKDEKIACEFLSEIGKPLILSEIGKERIRRAGDKIKKEIEQENQQLKLGEEPKKVPDIGFKVFQLDSSNIKKWNPDTKDLEKSLFDQVNNFVDGRTEEDVLYEIILKCGLDLTVPVEELNIHGKKVYSVGMGALIVCLDNDITLEVANAIAKLDTVFEDKQNVTVVFKDNGFKDDSVKTNIKETIRGYGIGKFVTV